MATVTQQIPNYILGISEQPDELKLQGQVRDLKNAIPDVTLGCVKRAGSKFIKKITPSSGSLSWFHIYRDDDDQYIGNVNTSGQLQIWRTRDGFSYHDNNGQGTNLIDYSAVTGTNAATYLTGWTDSTDIQALTLNEQTFLTNRTKTTQMKPVKDANGNVTGDGSPELVNEVIVEIKTISYGKQYALNIYDPANPGTPLTETRATSIAARSNFTEGGSPANDGSCKAMGREVINQGTISGKKNLRYEIDVRCVPVVDPNNIGNQNTGPQYNDAYTEFAKLQFGGEGWATGQTHDYTTEKNGTGTVEIKSHTTMTSSANIAAVRPAATSSSADEAVTASGILGDMKASLDAISGTGITATITGNCLHLKRNTPFAVSTPEPQLINIITNQAQSVADLPSNCRHNYVVKIVNSGDDDDDFYLKFKQANAGTANQDYFGEGVWEECPAPSIEIEINKDTMPIKIVRELAGNVYPQGRFLVQSIDYAKRDVGDDNTNPVPSFIGSTLEKMLFFRNRLCVLSKGNVILSKTNDFFNFFSTTAMSESTADPIDLQASSTFPTTLFDGIEVNSGLLIFSSNQQFMLTTDSDALTPSTAKINYLASYNYNPKTKPFSLGVTSGFINSTGKNARIFEMADIKREGEPTVLEQSKLVSKKLPITIVKPTTSKENSLLLLGGDYYSTDSSTNEVWGFRFYSNGEKRVQSAWFRWILTGNLVHHVILDDVYYAVVYSGGEFILEAFDVKKQSDTTLIGVEDYPIHLDRHTQISALSAGSYNATTKKTTFTRPTGFASTAQLAVYNHNSGNDIGKYALATTSGSDLVVEGDWTGHTFMLGYLYDYLVEIPTIFVTSQAGEKSRSDTRSSLIIHRLHFAFGAVGNIDTVIKRTGRVDATKNFSAAEIDSIKANELPVVEDYIQTIPIYERNTNLTVQIKSTHPSPTTLYSMNWEGDYNPRYYRRV
tara:strand:+ start:620 stop:3472 length:2853 start_codon:yes stop_codon:yes gene_type:complete